MYRIVLSKGGEEEFNTVMQQYVGASNDETRRWGLATLGYASTPALKAKVLDWSISGDVKLQDCYSPMLSVGSSGLEGANLTWSWFKDQFNKIKDFAGNGNAWMLQAVIASCTG